VTFHLFVLPALQKMAGWREPWGLPRVRVRVGEDVRRDRSRLEFVRAVVGGAEGVEGGLVAWSTGGQRSSRIGSFKGANALLVVEAGDGVVKKGEVVEALMMGQVGGL